MENKDIIVMVVFVFICIALFVSIIWWIYWIIKVPEMLDEQISTSINELNEVNERIDKLHSDNHKRILDQLNYSDEDFEKHGPKMYNYFDK